MQKIGFGVGSMFQKLRNFVTPEIGTLARQAADPGRRVLRPGLKTPLMVAGLAGATYGASEGMGYLGDQAGLISRARGYRRMMEKYGPELNAIAEQTHAQVPEGRVRDVYNALFKIAPDIAKEPTLAAAQMAPLIRSTGSPEGTMEGPDGPQPRVMLESGLEQLMPASRIQSGMPQGFAEATQPWVRSAMGAMGDYDPSMLAQREMVGQEFTAPDMRAKDQLAMDLGSLGRRRMELQALYRAKADAMKMGDQGHLQAIEQRLQQLRTGRPEMADRI